MISSGRPNFGPGGRKNPHIMEHIMTFDTDTLAEAPEQVGTANPGAPPAAAPRVLPRDARQLRMAQSFSNAVAVLMRDTTFRNFKLADLEWLVLPPIMAGQFKLGHAQADQDSASQRPDGMLAPVALTVWARVSPAIDKTLSESHDEKLWLRANEWASGDNIWIMAVAGDPRAIPTFLKQLMATEFKDQRVRMRTRGSNGELVIKTLNDTV